MILAYFRRLLAWAIKADVPRLCEFPGCWRDSCSEYRIQLTEWPWYSNICDRHYDWLYKMDKRRTKP